MKKNILYTALPIMFVEGSVDLRPFVHQFAKKFLSTYYSFSFNSVHPRRGQRPSMLFALCLLLSSSQLTSLSLNFFFSISRDEINSRFYCDIGRATISSPHRLFLTKRPFFSIYPWQLTHEISSRQFNRVM